MIISKRNYKARKHGFTILELLVAISVLSVVIAIVYESFASVLDSTEMARGQAEQLRFRQFLWRHLNQNISSAYSDPACMSPEYEFLGKDGDGPMGPADSLHFCTSLPMDGPKSLPGVLKLVSYEVSADGEADGGGSMLGEASIDQGGGDNAGGTVLIIREDPLILDSDEMDDPTATADFPQNELRIPIASMDLQYYDGNTDEWLAEWDSLTEGRLPWAVQIRINFQRTEEEARAEAQSGINPIDEPDLNLTIPFPSGDCVVDQFMDLNHRRTTVTTDTANGDDMFGKGVDTKTKKNDKKGEEEYEEFFPVKRAEQLWRRWILMRRVKRHNAGVALILALLFVVLLTVIIVEFSYETQVEGSFASNQGNDFGAYLAAKSAVARGMALLSVDLLSDLENGQPGQTGNAANRNQQNITKKPATNPANNPAGTPGTGQPEYAGQQIDSLVDSSGWAAGIPFEPLNEAMMRASISDEYGKINLNALLDTAQQTPVEREWLVNALREFFKFRCFDSEESATAIVDSILDWLDYDDQDEEHPEGAEKEYYSGLENPIACKNGPMDSIEELLLIKYMTPEIYFGNPDKEQLPLSEYLTVHGDWQGRVNINTAREEVIAAMVAGSTGNFDMAQAQQIHESVMEQPVMSISELSRFGIPTQAGQGTANQPGILPNANPQTPAQKPTGKLSQLNVLDMGRGPETMAALTPDEGGDAAKQSLTGRTSLLGGTGSTSQTGSKPLTGSTGQTTPNLDPNQPGVPGQGGSGEMYRVSSNVFRIYGDGMEGDVMVRIVAYVWRTPLVPEDTMGMPQPNQPNQLPNQQPNQPANKPQQGSLEGENADDLPMEATTMPAETFRILDWKVIR